MGRVCGILRDIRAREPNSFSSTVQKWLLQAGRKIVSDLEVALRLVIEEWDKELLPDWAIDPTKCLTLRTQKIPPEFMEGDLKRCITYMGALCKNIGQDILCELNEARCPQDNSPHIEIQMRFPEARRRREAVEYEKEEDENQEDENEEGDNEEDTGEGDMEVDDDEDEEDFDDSNGFGDTFEGIFLQISQPSHGWEL